MRAAGSMRIATGILLFAVLAPTFARDMLESDAAYAVDVLRYDVAVSLDFDGKALTSTTKSPWRAAVFPSTTMKRD